MSPTRTRSSTPSSISSSARSNCRWSAANGGARCAGGRSSARRVLNRHPWATPLLQSRLNPGPFTLRHHNAFIGCLRAAGFSMELTAHAFALIDSYVFGFAMSEAALPINGPDSVADIAESMMQQFFDPAAYPYLLEFTTEHVMRPGLRLRRGVRVRAHRDPRRPRDVGREMSELSCPLKASAAQPSLSAQFVRPGVNLVVDGFPHHLHVGSGDAVAAHRQSESQPERGTDVQTRRSSGARIATYFGSRPIPAPCRVASNCAKTLVEVNLAVTWGRYLVRSRSPTCSSEST